MESKEKVDPVQKVDMVISYISDCILELDVGGTGNQVPEIQIGGGYGTQS